MLPQAPYAVDAHAHVFRRGLPVIANARYVPDYDATLAAWLAQLDANGITHGVLVQLSFLGTDNGHLLEALEAARGRLRATVQADPTVTDAVLRDWDRRGVRGVRLNTFEVSRRPDLASTEWRTFLARLAGLGWHLELHDAGAGLAALLNGLEGTPARIVVDHFAHPAERDGFDAMLRLAERHQVYVKLSAPYRQRDADCARHAATLLAQLGAGRLMWGSDWPHTRFEGVSTYASPRGQLDAWVPDAESRRSILWNTPAEVFRFGH